MVASKNNDSREDGDVDKPNDEFHAADGKDSWILGDDVREFSQAGGGTHLSFDVREDGDGDHGGEETEDAGDEEVSVVTEDVGDDAADNRSPGNPSD